MLVVNIVPILLLFLVVLNAQALPKCNVNPNVEQQYQNAKRLLSLNTPDAIEKIRQAAFQGHAVAAHELGFYYVKGHFVPKDLKLAYDWFKIGATRGQHNSMFSLAIMNRKGEGRPVDLPAAYAWYRLAGKYIPSNLEEFSIPRSKVELYKNAAKVVELKLSKKQLLKGKQYMQIFEKEIICKWYSQ